MASPASGERLCLLWRVLIEPLCSAVPTVLTVGPYRLFFFSDEGREPPHVHVERDQHTAKFWLAPIRVARNNGFSARELRRIMSLVEKHEQACWQAWRGYFG